MTDMDVFEPDGRTRRPSLLPGNPAGIFGEWFGRFLKRHVPSGYEDETGFHYGTHFRSNRSSSAGPSMEQMVALPGGDFI